MLTEACENSIVFQNVCFEYTPGVPVIRDVSLRIDSGEFVAVIGHNGSGKSTLAKLINAVLLPASGKVTVFGMDTADESLTGEIRKNAGMVFQNPDNQIVATTVEEDTAFAPENLGMPPERIRETVDSALSAVDMLKYASHSPSKLSGGQKQRVAIAGILAMHPRCIILDEPTAMLDPQGRREVMAALKKLSGEGITVIMVTHYMEEAVQAGRVLIMSYGRLAQDGSPREVFSDGKRLAGYGLEPPAAAALAMRLREMGADIGRIPLDPAELAERVRQLAGGAK